MLEYGIFIIIILVLIGLMLLKGKGQNEFQLPIRSIPVLTLFYREKVWVHVYHTKLCLDNSQNIYVIDNKSYSFDQKQIFLLNVIYKEGLVKIILFWVGFAIFRWSLGMINNNIKDFWIILVYCYLFYGMFIPLIGEIFCFRANKLKR